MVMMMAGDVAMAVVMKVIMVVVIVVIVVVVMVVMMVVVERLGGLIVGIHVPNHQHFKTFDLSSKPNLGVPGRSSQIGRVWEWSTRRLSRSRGASAERKLGRMARKRAGRGDLGGAL